MRSHSPTDGSAIGRRANDSGIAGRDMRHDMIVIGQGIQQGGTHDCFCNRTMATTIIHVTPFRKNHGTTRSRCCTDGRIGRPQGTRRQGCHKTRMILILLYSMTKTTIISTAPCKDTRRRRRRSCLLVTTICSTSRFDRDSMMLTACNITNSHVFLHGNHHFGGIISTTHSSRHMHTFSWNVTKNVTFGKDVAIGKSRLSCRDNVLSWIAIAQLSKFRTAGGINVTIVAQCHRKVVSTRNLNHGFVFQPHAFAKIHDTGGTIAHTTLSRLVGPDTVQFSFLS
mmetsp:Transcript_10812/g.19604  ORF Transcript_10812/g.19604 Transcript_10812/m.19604 type:complete len:282 (+) Transcript_10812:1385-2230(+)